MDIRRINEVDDVTGEFMGIVSQFLGTLFEKCVMSIVTIVGFCADTRIAFEKRW